MWFRNLQVFRLQDEGFPASDALAEKLAQTGFQPCGAMDRHTQGWVPPRDVDGEWVLLVSSQMLFALGVEQKLLPVSVVRQYAKTRIAQVEAMQGYKVGRKQSREIFDALESELLPRALLKRRLTYVWVDPRAGWLVVDAAGTAKADEVITQLKESLGALPLKLLKTKLAPGTAMTQWLSLGECPSGFSIDQDCELRVPGESGGAVRYVRHTLESPDVRQHLAQGKTVTRLALTWRDRVSLVLTEQMQIKRVAFLDILKEQAEKGSNGKDAAETFAEDFVIMAGELSRMLGELVEALGGEAE